MCGSGGNLFFPEGLIPRALTSVADSMLSCAGEVSILEPWAPAPRDASFPKRVEGKYFYDPDAPQAPMDVKTAIKEGDAAALFRLLAEAPARQ